MGLLSGVVFSRHLPTRSLSGLGLDPNMMLHAAVNLFACVRGCAMNVEMELESEQDTGLTDDQWLESQGAQFARVVAAGGYPRLARLIATAEVDLDLDRLFEFGLERLLDGYAALIERRELPSPAADASRPDAFATEASIDGTASALTAT
jgi:hypothetical protein